MDEVQQGDRAHGLSRRSVVGSLLAGGMAGALTPAAAAWASPPQARAAASPESLSARRRFVETASVPVDVRDYGAVGDGTTDDSSSVQAAIEAAESSGRSMTFPPGDYKITQQLTVRSDMRWSGSGMWRTSIVRAFADPLVLFDSAAGLHVDLEGIAFDLDGKKASALAIDGLHVASLSVKECRFTSIDNIPANAGSCHIKSVDNAYFADCLWHNPARYAGYGTAVSIAAGVGSHRVQFQGNNKFLWLNFGILADANVAPAVKPRGYLDYLSIEGAYFDGFWWLLPASESGSGSGVEYTANSLSDPAADFSGVAVGAYPHLTNVRVLRERHSGQLGLTDGNRMVDADPGVDLSAVELKRGDIVRVAGAFAVISGVDAAPSRKVTSLMIEGWLDDTTLLPVPPPAAGTSYVASSVLIGGAVASTTTTLTIDYWRDLHGNAVVPTSGERYEVLQTRPTYLCRPTGAAHLQVTNSVFRRGWADQCAVGAAGFAEVTFTGNHVEDGQDYGATINAKNATITGNVFKHNGTGGLFVKGGVYTITGNTFVANDWNLEP